MVRFGPALLCTMAPALQPRFPIPIRPMFDKRYYPRLAVASGGNRWDWAFLPLVLAVLFALAYGGSLESDYGNWQYYQNTCHAMPAGYYAMSRAGIGEFVVSYMC